MASTQHIQSGSRLWREAVRCFVRNWKAWLRPATWLFLAQAVMITLSSSLHFEEHGYSNLFTVIAYVAFVIFFMRREPLGDAPHFDFAKFKLVMRQILPLLPLAILLLIVATALVNTYFIFGKLGLDVSGVHETSHGLAYAAPLYVALTLSQLAGMGLFVGTLKYYTFRLTQFAVLTAHDADMPAGNKATRRKRFWRLVLNYLVIWLGFALVLIVLMSAMSEMEDIFPAISSTWSETTTNVVATAGALFGTALLAIVGITGIAMGAAFACTATRIFHDEDTNLRLTGVA